MFRNATSAPKTIFYPASFLVMTVTSLLLLWAAAGLGVMLIHYWLTGVSGILNDTIIIYWLASLLVVVPMHLLAYWQVRHTDKSLVTQFSLRFAHGLLGAHLFVVVATSILLVTWVVGLALNALLGTGEFDKSWLAATLSLLQAIAWFRLTATHFAGVRSNESQPKYYVAIVGGLAAALLVVTVVFPLMSYRSVAHDFVKENDLNSISHAVGDYVDTHSALPTTLNGLSGLSDETTRRLGNYQYTAKGESSLGVFGYELCASFERSKDKGRDIGFGFASHSAGKQCFARTTVSFDALNQGLSKYITGVENGAAKLQIALQHFLLGAKTAVDQEIAGVEGFAGQQIKQLETDLEGLEGGTTQLQQEMERLEGNLGTLGGNTGELAQDFAELEKFLHDLGCLFGCQE